MSGLGWFVLCLLPAGVFVGIAALCRRGEREAALLLESDEARAFDARVEQINSLPLSAAVQKVEALLGDATRSRVDPSTGIRTTATLSPLTRQLFARYGDIRLLYNDALAQIGPGFVHATTIPSLTIVGGTEDGNVFVDVATEEISMGFADGVSPHDVVAPTIYHWLLWADESDYGNGPLTV